jgi:hypothetical protein
MSDNSLVPTSYISISDEEKLENYGKQIYHSNKTMRDIANLMEHPVVEDFANRYFKDEHDAEAMIKMLLTYHKLKNCDKKSLSPYQKVAFLYELMGNRASRQKILFDTHNLKSIEN